MSENAPADFNGMSSGPRPGPADPGGIPPDPNHDAMFPTLTAVQIARIARLAQELRFPDGAMIWKQGDTNRPLLVVLEGGIEIRSGRAQVVTVHEPGGFSGDVDLLSGRPVVVSAFARGATTVLEVPPDRVRTLIQTDSELSEIFLRAFLLRRSALMAQGYGSLVLLGSMNCKATLELREFLARNSQPHAFIDLDVQPDVQQTLDSFKVGPEDVPVIICRGERILKRPTIQELGECLGLTQLRQDTVRDLVVIGAGPAGLAAAVYAASEGLDALIV